MPDGMKRRVSYARQTYDSPNPLTRFAHRSRYKLSLDLADRLLPEGGCLVDFGAGEGAFLHQFEQHRSDATLVAIEPIMPITFPGVRRVESVDMLEDGSVDVLGTFEVLEHVSDAQLEDFLVDARRILKPGGKLLVTVPIMYGMALPAKELSRALLHRRWGDTGLVEMIKGTFGKPIPRAADRLRSHKGFDFRELRGQISRHFRIIEPSYSPFPTLPWWLNSQAVCIAE